MCVVSLVLTYEPILNGGPSYLFIVARTIDIVSGVSSDDHHHLGVLLLLFSLLTGSVTSQIMYFEWILAGLVAL